MGQCNALVSPSLRPKPAELHTCQIRRLEVVPKASRPDKKTSEQGPKWTRPQVRLKEGARP